MLLYVWVAPLNTYPNSLLVQHMLHPWEHLILYTAIAALYCENQEENWSVILLLHYQAQCRKLFILFLCEVLGLQHFTEYPYPLNMMKIYENRPEMT